MIKIISSSQMKSLDEHTIQHEPVSSIDLMERASRGFVTWFTEQFNALKKVGVVCGTGNNGGDGLAIARMLNDWGYPIKVWIVKGSVSESNDFKANFARLQEEKIPLFEITTPADRGLFNDRDVLIDAVFGYGLSRPAEGIYAQVIECINSSKATRVSVDIPSGLMADKPSTEPIVKANHTVTFQVPKLSFLLPQYHEFVGNWTVIDIGLHKEFLRKEKSDYFLTTRKSVGKLLRPRDKFDHKGTFGHALLVAGSYGKMGAAVLSGRAVKRSGVGLLTIYSPACGYNILQSSVPEAMVITDPENDLISAAPEVEKYDVLGIGPGLGQDERTVKVLGKLLESGKPCVIDADALNMISSHRELFHLIPQGSILTPHPKEFERLVGKWNNDFERLDRQRELSQKIKGVVVVKGGYTSIALPDGTIYFNSTGNPGMATGGTGDVLTGILTGILAQGYRSGEAAILGVYLHGSAGDLAVLETGPESLIASDLIRFLPNAFRQLSR